MERTCTWKNAAGLAAAACAAVLVPLWALFAACCWCAGRLAGMAEAFGPWGAE